MTNFHYLLTGCVLARCRLVSDSHGDTWLSVNMFQIVLKRCKISGKYFCRVCLRKIRGKCLETAFRMCEKWPFSGFNASSPPPSPRKSWFFDLLFAHFEACFQIFKANSCLKLTTFGGQTDHFEGQNWSLSRWNLCRTVAKLGFFTLATRLRSVQNKDFRGS